MTDARAEAEADGAGFGVSMNVASAACCCALRWQLGVVGVVMAARSLLGRAGACCVATNGRSRSETPMGIEHILRALIEPNEMN
jgi:hypothetical protein